MFPDEPLRAIPVEAFGGVTDARKMYTCFVGKNTEITQRNCQEGVNMTVNCNLLHFLCLRSARAELKEGRLPLVLTKV